MNSFIAIRRPKENSFLKISKILHIGPCTRISIILFRNKMSGEKKGRGRRKNQLLVIQKREDKKCVNEREREGGHMQESHFERQTIKKKKKKMKR